MADQPSNGPNPPVPSWPAYEQLADAVAEDTGIWYVRAEPTSLLDELVHNADMLASTANATVKLLSPVPQELDALGVESAEL